MTTFSLLTAQQLVNKNIIDSAAVEVFERGDAMGKSVRARRAFQVGQVVCSYGGKVYPVNAETDALLRGTAYRFVIDHSCEVDGNPDLDETKGHVGSFINDAKGPIRVAGARNNVTIRIMFIIHDGQLNRALLVVAKRAIEIGDEIWMSYGPSYWVAAPAPSGAMNGSSNRSMVPVGRRLMARKTCGSADTTTHRVEPQQLVPSHHYPYLCKNGPHKKICKGTKTTAMRAVKSKD